MDWRMSMTESKDHFLSLNAVSGSEIRLRFHDPLTWNNVRHFDRCDLEYLLRRRYRIITLDISPLGSINLLTLSCIFKLAGTLVQSGKTIRIGVNRNQRPIMRKLLKTLEPYEAGVRIGVFHPSLLLQTESGRFGTGIPARHT